ncbi:MAG: ribosome small subunit-dependent GTPase A [Myxococcales bacterium]|nr:ribosome small subunit-dependent GTPase A [Myxococcales bacterium]
MFNDLETPALSALGFDDHFASQLPDPDAWDRAARVAVEHRGRYLLLSPAGTREAVLSGRLRHAVGFATELPRVGDWVELGPHATTGVVVIERVLERKTSFARRDPGQPHGLQVIAANIDAALVVCAESSSDDARVRRRGVNLARLERHATAVRQSGARPVFVINKLDLAADPERTIASVRAVARGAEVIATSAFTGAGIERLRAAIGPRETLVLVGPSGVGKSALTNRLLGREVEKVGAVRGDDERGRHTTTHRELFILPGGGLLIDTPGMRELGLSGEDVDVDLGFDEIAALGSECRFRDCRHAGEPGCAVIAAIARGELDERRLRSRQKLERELEHAHEKLDPMARSAQKRMFKTRARAHRLRDKLGK